MRALTHPDLAQVDITTVLHALSDPVRLQVVRDLYGRSCYCSELKVPVKPATLSHHLKVLREAGIIRVSAEGSHRSHQLRWDELNRRFPGLIATVLDAPAPVPVPVPADGSGRSG